MPDQAPLPRVHKSFLMLDVEAMFFGVDIRLVLIQLFNELGSKKAVARRLGLSPQTITLWFRDLGIVVRQRHEAILDPRRHPAPPQPPKG